MRNSSNSGGYSRTIRESSRTGCAGFGYNYDGDEDCDILVYDNCNRNSDSYTHFGTYSEYTVYANDTQFEYPFTGAHEFKVKEIEVFEIKD
jgi:hypothetical protein